MKVIIVTKAEIPDGDYCTEILYNKETGRDKTYFHCPFRGSEFIGENNQRLIYCQILNIEISVNKNEFPRKACLKNIRKDK